MLNLNLETAEILSHDDFWARNPAPGTKFFELGESLMELVGSKIDPELDDPDNAVAIGFVRPATKEIGDGGYVILSWGSWDTAENREIFELQQAARKTMEKEQADG